MTEHEIRENFFHTRDAAAALKARTERVDRLVLEHWAAMPPGIALAAVGVHLLGRAFDRFDWSEGSVE